MFTVLSGVFGQTICQVVSTSNGQPVNPEKIKSQVVIKAESNNYKTCWIARSLMQVNNEVVNVLLLTTIIMGLLGVYVWGWNFLPLYTL